MLGRRKQLRRNRCRSMMVKGVICLSATVILYLVFWGRADAGKAEKKAFLAAYGQFYGYNNTLDKLREKNFPYLSNNVYLDYTGSGLYQCKQLDQFTTNLHSTLYGNIRILAQFVPHLKRLVMFFKPDVQADSPSSCSKTTESKVDHVRQLLLSFFGTNSEEYEVVFTGGCTGALKLLGETYRWSEDSRFYYLLENHNSVLGIREWITFLAVELANLTNSIYVKSYGGKFMALSETEVEKIIWEAGRVGNTDDGPPVYNLFAYPAEDNFQGSKYSLEWIELVHKASTPHNVWMVLLDSAAYVPNTRLDLGRYKPDFVTISFYKIFGFPTGLGALIARKDSLNVLRNVYWGGGTVIASLSQLDWHLFVPTLHERFEAGTINFLDIIAVEYGLDIVWSLGGMDMVQMHTWYLTKYLFNALSSLRHKNGHPVCRIYGNHFLGDPNRQGPVVTFNILDGNGNYVAFDTFNTLAANNNIHVRVGCMCNPGACHKALGFTAEQVMEVSEKKLDDCFTVDLIGDRPFGSMRASIGYPTTFEDVHSLIELVSSFAE